MTAFFYQYSFLCWCSASATDLREDFLLSDVALSYTASQHLAQPAFIKASLGAPSFSFKVEGPPTEVTNKDPAHLFVLITQCSVQGSSR